MVRPAYVRLSHTRGTVPILTHKNKGGVEKERFYHVSLFLQKSVYNNVKEIREFPYFPPPIHPYFLGVRVGRYAVTIPTDA